jgi:tetratricopeptide (TPR) repeat protein
MSESLPERYSNLIEQIVQLTLKGNIRSKEQVYQMLVQEIEPDSGDVFETTLRDRVTQTQQQANDKSNELKQAKAMRAMRALQTIEGEWKRWQAENQTRGAIASAVHQIIQAEPGDRLFAFLRVSDPNHPQSLNADQLRQLANTLQQQPISNPDTKQELIQIADGIDRGLHSWSALQPHLVSWIYSPEQMGFGSTSRRSRPWELWSKQAVGSVPKSFFVAMNQDQSAIEWAETQSETLLDDWIEFAIVLQTLQRGLISWAENLIYSSKLGSSLSTSVFLTFAIIWSLLANGFARSTYLNSINRDRFSEASFRITLQGLRVFAQRDYFPLYGTFFASFTGTYFREAMNYLSEPLKRAEGTQEQARILTLLGSSQRLAGVFDAAKDLHTTARDIAQEAGDRKCEIANLNHLSRIAIDEKNYAEAIHYSQRALMLSRQSGDRMGEANALANLGYSEVFQAQQLESSSDVYETAISYLEQGLALSENLGDLQSQALCSISLGNAYIALSEPEKALTHLEVGSQSAANSGDRYLQALSFAAIAEALYQLQTYDKAIFAAAIAMYQLEQMGSNDWRPSAGLLTILRGQLGDRFSQILQDQRSRFIQEIGVDGFDYLFELLDRYTQNG